jgi:chemotaxis protein histidine kinase CheA
MGDITNILLGALITLIGAIAMVGYNKIEQFAKQLERIAEKIERIMLADVGSESDIRQLRRDVDDHEARLQNLEK